MDKMAITPKGLKLMLAGVIVMVAGYILMMGGGSPDPAVSTMPCSISSVSWRRPS